MIVPYFNALLLTHSKNSIDLQQQQVEVMREFMQELLTNNHQLRQIDVRILLREINTKDSVCQQIKRLIVGLFGEMEDMVCQINGSFSAKKETKLIYQALRQIEIKQGINQKQPVQLQNLNMLKQYYRLYKSEAEMKDFLKNLLIEEISTEKKTIRYRKAEQVDMLLKVMAAQLTGEIKVTYCNRKQSLLAKDQINEDKTIIWVLSMSREEIKNLSITQLIQKIERRYKIDRSVNSLITNHMTLSYIKSQSRTILKQMATKYQLFLLKQASNAVKTLKEASQLYSNIIAVKKYGLKLVEEEESLQLQFIKFVEEMKVKFTAKMEQYIKSWLEQKEFSIKQKKYRDGIRNTLVIAKYIATAKQLRRLTIDKKIKNHNDCKIIQNRIKSFLIIKSTQRQILSQYLSRKNVWLTAENKLYQQIKELYNHHELQKLSVSNKYKYGFVCTTHILAISNHSGYSGFSAEHLLQFIQKANKTNELFVKIRCEQSYMQVTTIEGKTYTIGHKKNSLSTSTRYNNKQNYSNFSNSAKMSARSSNFNSRSLETSVFNKISPAQSKFSSKFNSLTTSRKEFPFINNNTTNRETLDFEMKLDESGRLFVHGDNSFGQLGLGSVQHADNFTCILPTHKVKLFATIHHHTIIITTENRVFYCGKQKGKWPQSNTPQQIVLKDKIIIKQIVCSINDTFFLTEHNKIYSVDLMRFLVIPKPIQLQMQQFHLVRTGTYNLQIVYLVAFWTNTLDKVQKEQISRFLTSNNHAQICQSDSLLVEDLPFTIGEGQGNNIGDLSAILQSPLE